MTTSILRNVMYPVVVTGVLLFIIGCDSSDPDGDWMDIAEVRISPDSAAIQVGESVDFSFALLSATGDTIRDVEMNTRWESTDTSVFTVEDNGLATGTSAGTAKCVIEVSSYPLLDLTADDDRLSKDGSGGASKGNPLGSAAVMGFVGQDSARVVVF